MAEWRLVYVSGVEKMNLIEQLGGYEEAKKQGEEWGFDDHLSNALLEYRRANGN